MLSIRVNLLLLTKIMQLLDVGERQEQRALDRLSPGSLAPAHTHMRHSFLCRMSRTETKGAQTMGTSVHSQAPLCGEPQQTGAAPAKCLSSQCYQLELLRSDRFERWSLMGCCLWGCTESDTTEAT